MPPSVYLAGPIRGQDYHSATGWRDYCYTQLRDSGILAYSPMRGKAYLRGAGTLRDSYEGTLLSGEKAILARDKFDVQRCDMLLVNLLDAPAVSMGTCVEYGWASALSKPIVTIMEDGNVHQHSFITGLSGWVVDSLEDGLAIVKAVLLP